MSLTSPRVTLASYWVLDLMQVWSVGLLVAQASRAREAGISALADLTVQAFREGWS